MRDEHGNALASTGLTGVPAAKTFRLPHGETVQAPRHEATEVLGRHVPASFPGGPIEPAGNKLTAGVGPGAYANRADVPDRQFADGLPRIVPLRADLAYSLAVEDTDPRGLKVLGADGKQAGVVSDVWVDRSEAMVRYFEITLSHGGRTVLVPSTMVDIQGDHHRIVVDSILAAQFADVPGLKLPNEVTALEEDKIMAYYGAGTLYATPARAEPLV